MLFKIRRKSDGQYLEGSYWKEFGNKGGVWSSIGRACAAINRKENSFTEEQLMDLEIVELGEIRSYSIAHELDRINKEKILKKP